MRFLAAILAALLLAGCGAGSRQPAAVPERPAASASRTLLVLVDHFHGALVAPTDALDPDLAEPLAAHPGPWTAFHFGEARWMTDLRLGTCHGALLGLTGGEGLVEQDRLAALDEDGQAYIGFDPDRLRIWRFTVDEAGWRAWQEHLRRHWLAGGTLPPPLPGPTIYRISPRRWTLANNCHDFVFDLLGAAGVVVPWRPLRGARQAALDLDRMLVTHGSGPGSPPP